MMPMLPGRSRRRRHLTIPHLTWATIQEQGGADMPWYDVNGVEQIIRPVSLQPDPKQKNDIFYTHFEESHSAC